MAIPLQLGVGDRIQNYGAPAYSSNRVGEKGTIVKVHSQRDGYYGIQWDNGKDDPRWYVLDNEYMVILRQQPITDDEIKKAAPYATIDDLMSFMRERLVKE